MPVRLKIIIHGAVQGVGFRPFIYRLATEMELNGYVLNNSEGVFIEVEGTKETVDIFVKRIEQEKPALAYISSLEFSYLDAIGYDKFEIRHSSSQGEVSAFIMPDIATCPDCIEEMFDPLNRRYLYPFINCTNCGPRFSIIEKLPYDRPNTSMKNFEMCPECKKEYENPLDRRYHAQPTACSVCGPHVELWDAEEKIISKNNDAIVRIVEIIRQGKIVALKSIGGYQLLADACNSAAVNRLRERKHREEKPFALIFTDIESIKEICFVSDIEERTLLSPESPIVLLKRNHNLKEMSFLRKQESIIKNSPVPEVAPGNPYLGIMLPYTPLHHLLMKELNSPVIATSGNLSEEPICINESEAYEKLKNIADYFLVHDRPIVRHVDDSIVRIIAGRPMVMRRARGYAPLPIQIEDNNNDSQMLAVGGHLKNTIALKSGKNVFISQHIGDLSTNEAYQTFQKVIQDFQLMYGIPHPKIICDSHPEYLSHKFAKELQKDSFEIQHHIAHVASCRAENYITGNALGVAFDGTGFGFDGSIWGGEFFLSTDNTFKHVAQFRQFPLPGGEIAIKEPRRSALGMLYEIYGERLFDINGNSHLLKGRLIGFTTDELKVLHQLLVKKVNAPITSSVGRIFDAVASMLDLTQISNYEAQAAMLVEFAADYSTHLYKEAKKEFYKFNIIEKNILYIDWQPMVEEILEDKSNNINVSSISQKFHNTICRIILDIAERIGENKIILSGGCFQNAILTENTIKLLQENNFSVYWHQRIPPNDGGISLGQIAAANILEK